MTTELEDRPHTAPLRSLLYRGGKFQRGAYHLLSMGQVLTMSRNTAGAKRDGYMLELARLAQRQSAHSQNPTAWDRLRAMALASANRPTTPHRHSCALTPCAEL